MKITENMDSPWTYHGLTMDSDSRIPIIILYFVLSVSIEQSLHNSNFFEVFEINFRRGCIVNNKEFNPTAIVHSIITEGINDTSGHTQWRPHGFLSEGLQ